MRSRAAIATRVISAALLISAGGSFAWAQLDPKRILLEGTVAGIRDNGRTMIIRSVKPSDNGWSAEDFYATSASNGKGQRMIFAEKRDLSTMPAATIIYWKLLDSLLGWNITSDCRIENASEDRPVSKTRDLLAQRR